MAMNLRLSPNAEQAVRREAERSGRSQQEVIRAAVAGYLGLPEARAPRTELDALIAIGTVRAPRQPFRRLDKRLTLAPGLTTADLLDRDDRI
jgi:hypothetical protein